MFRISRRSVHINCTDLSLNLVSRKSKLKLYWSVIRPIIVYGCETWVFKESIIQKLSVFERKILRKIFGPTKEANCIWRIKTNKQLDELIKHRNITNYLNLNDAIPLCIDYIYSLYWYIFQSTQLYNEKHKLCFHYIVVLTGIYIYIYQ